MNMNVIKVIFKTFYHLWSDSYFPAAHATNVYHIRTRWKTLEGEKNHLSSSQTQHLILGLMKEISRED